MPALRLAPAANGQRKRIRPAEDYLYPELNGRQPATELAQPLAMLLDPSPE